MADSWDDSDDDWDKDDDEDDELNARLKQLESKDGDDKPKKTFDDEEDLAIAEKEEKEKAQHADLKRKGKALAAKKKAEQNRKDEEEVARQAILLEAEMEAKMSPEELKAMRQQKVEEADVQAASDLFGGIDSMSNRSAAQEAGDMVKMLTLTDHLKHARKVGQCIKKHKNVHYASAFLKEVIQQCKDVLDDAAISDVIKTCNVVKNEKVQASKRKVKGQAQKSAKRDKTAEAKARQLQQELFGDNDKYDKYDEYGEDYEDSFF